VLHARRPRLRIVSGTCLVLIGLAYLVFVTIHQSAPRPPDDGNKYFIYQLIVDDLLAVASVLTGLVSAVTGVVAVRHSRKMLKQAEIERGNGRHRRDEQ
jgi:hypothetical protein